MKTGRKLVVFSFLMVFAVSFVAGAGDCSVDIDVSDKGLTQNSAGFSVSPPSGYYYPEGGEWTMSIPIQAENVEVRDGDGDLLDKSVSTSTDLFKGVSFKNDKRISGGETYRFEISYEMPRGVILYDGSGYMEQYLPVSFYDGEKTVNVDYPLAWDVVNSSIDGGQERPGSVVYGSTYTDTLQLIFDGKYDYAPVRNYSAGIFNVSVPSRYSDYVLSKVRELDSFNSDIEQLTGIRTPEGFHIKYLPFDSGKMSSEASGQYYGGRIDIKASQLSESDLQHMETLTHELVHGYNDRLSSNSPDWWWEEGTAEYISHRILEQNGYNVSWLRPSRERVEYSFENCFFQKSFISDWSPVSGVYVRRNRPCSDGGTISAAPAGSKGSETGIDPVRDRNLLGYKYSELIVSEMFKNSSVNVADVYSLMLEKNVTFSDSRDLMNNQINYFASKALGRDLTGFLRDKGINTESWGYEEKQLNQAQEDLERINSSYTRFKAFKKYFRELENVRKDFYRGRFEETRKVSGILDEAEKRNNTLSRLLKKFNSTRSQIQKLDAQNKAEFFTSELREVNSTFELVKESRFEEASNRLTEIRNSAEKKSRKIEEARRKAGELERETGKVNILVKPFLMDADQSIGKARTALRHGNLKEAEKQLKASENKVDNAGVFAAVFYILLLAGSLLF